MDFLAFISFISNTYIIYTCIYIYIIEYIYIYIYRSIISTALDRQGTVDSNTSGYNASVHNPSKYFDKMSDVAWILTEELSKAFVPFVSFFFSGRIIMSQFEDGMKAFRSLLQVGLKIENLQNGFALDVLFTFFHL